MNKIQVSNIFWIKRAAMIMIVGLILAVMVYTWANKKQYYVTKQLSRFNLHEYKLASNILNNKELIIIDTHGKNIRLGHINNDTVINTVKDGKGYLEYTIVCKTLSYTLGYNKWFDNNIINKKIKYISNVDIHI